MGFMDLFNDEKEKKSGFKAGDVAADPVTEQPQSRDFGASAIIALITSAIATGTSVAGSKQAASAQEKSEKKQFGEGQRQFNESLQEQRRQSNLRGLDHLTGRRESATTASRQRNFRRDLLSAGTQGFPGGGGF